MENKRLYAAEYYSPGEVTELILKIQNYFKKFSSYRGLTILNVLTIDLIPWELATSIEQRLFDDPDNMWLELYRALYYVDREDVPLGLNSSRTLPRLVFEWRAKLGK